MNNLTINAFLLSEFFYEDFFVISKFIFNINLDWQFYYKDNFFPNLQIKINLL